MKAKNKALVMMFICITVGFSAPFINAYIEQKAIEKSIEIPFPGLIPWQFMTLFCLFSAIVFLVFYIHFDFKDGKNPTKVDGEKE